MGDDNAVEQKVDVRLSDTDWVIKFCNRRFIDILEKPFVVKASKNPKKAYESMQFSKFANLLPVDRTNKEAKKRKKMFDAIDVSGNGHLSLAELELGLQTLIG
eukprot:UN15316